MTSFLVGLSDIGIQSVIRNDGLNVKVYMYHFHI